ncbi:hypothetical protein CSHISOI_03204, partial [Colletotrichum shisoi]
VSRSEGQRAQTAETRIARVKGAYSAVVLGTFSLCVVSKQRQKKRADDESPMAEAWCADDDPDERCNSKALRHSKCQTC